MGRTRRVPDGKTTRKGINFCTKNRIPRLYKDETLHDYSRIIIIQFATANIVFTR